MSVTVFIANKNLESVQVSNQYFEPGLPEDKVLNPRYVSVPIYPEINFSNSNAYGWLKELLSVDLSQAEWFYEWPVDKLEDAVNQLRKIRPLYEPGNTRENPRALDVISHLEFIFQTAYYFREKVVAA
jgi:NADH:ubiquinone oxidoreductase subunit